MGLFCSCPAAAYLTTIPAVSCPENFGQIQKVAFQRLYASGVKNGLAAASDAYKKKATWTALLSAANSTKIVVSPFINNPTDGGGDARLSGGGNDDLGGVQVVLGANPVTFEGQLRSIPQSVVATMKKLMCEAETGNIGVYLFDEFGRVECQYDSTLSKYCPIPVRALFIGSLLHGNYDAQDANTISWQYLDNYSDTCKIFTPSDFNPLTDL